MYFFKSVFSDVDVDELEKGQDCIACEIEEGDVLVAKWRAEYEDDFTDPAGGSGLDSHV